MYGADGSWSEESTWTGDVDVPARDVGKSMNERVTKRSSVQWMVLVCHVSKLHLTAKEL